MKEAFFVIVEHEDKDSKLSKTDIIQEILEDPIYGLPCSVPKCVVYVTPAEKVADKVQPILK